MAKDKEHLEDLSAIAAQTMGKTREAMDNYFNFLHTDLLENDILSFAVAQIAQALPARLPQIVGLRIRKGEQVADTRNVRAFGQNRKWPRDCRTADKREELPTSH